MSTCGHTGQNASVVMKKEVTWATYIAGDILMRLSSAPLIATITHTDDDSLIGERFTTDKIKTMEGATGSLDGKFHPDTAGIKLHWTLGGENAVSDPSDSYIIVQYTGSTPYARLTKTGTSLLAELSSDGTSYSADTNFGVAGTLDLSTVATTTAANAAIEGYTDWTSLFVGNSAGVTANIADFAATNVIDGGEVVGSKIMGTVVTSTVAKAHDVFPADSATCLPSYSITIDKTLGTDKSLGYVGSKVNTMGITITAADLVTSSLALSIKDEEQAKTDITLDIPTEESYAGLKSTIIIDNMNAASTKDFAVNINNSLSEDSVIGSSSIEEQLAQGGVIDFTGTINLTDPDNDIHTKRAKFLNDTPMETIIYMESTDYADLANSVPYSVLIVIPRAKFTNFDEPISGPDRITIAVSGTAVKPVSTYEHIQCLIVDQITTTY